jgi:hypothetical protein
MQLLFLVIQGGPGSHGRLPHHPLAQNDAQEVKRTGRWTNLWGVVSPPHLLGCLCRTVYSRLKRVIKTDRATAEAVFYTIGPQLSVRVPAALYFPQEGSA